MASAMSPTIRYSKFMDVSLHRASLDTRAGVDKRRQRDKGHDGDHDEEDVRHDVWFLKNSSLSQLHHHALTMAGRISPSTR